VEIIDRPHWHVNLLIGVLAGAALLSGAYLYREKRQAQDLAATNQVLSATVSQLQNRLQDLTQRMDDLKATPVVKVRPAKASVAPKSKAVGPKNDPRFKELEGRLSEQQKQLASTRDDLNAALNSTKDELSGSIARTHEDVVALQKRGERNYYEFNLDKSKEFQRVGPLRLALRKADTKHKRFDMNLLVDDNQLEKKKVNLYETIWINTGDHPQPMELVVNQIAKDHIQGYLSEPKYKMPQRCLKGDRRH
jgi:uncharacterized coiled-coil protein SlyX